jgi:hypothetical protein
MGRAARAVVLGCLFWAAPLAVSGCGPLADLEPGSCELEVSKDTANGLEALAPPYVVDLPAPASGGHLAISLSGSGFRDARLVVIGPSGFMEEDSPGLQEYLNETSVAFTVDRPGHWQVHLLDDVAGCRFDFTVEAHKPT